MTDVIRDSAATEQDRPSAITFGPPSGGHP